MQYLFKAIHHQCIGIIAFTLLIFNTIIMCIPFYCIALLKLCFPFMKLKKRFSRWLIVISENWILLNIKTVHHISPTQYRIQNKQEFTYHDWYFVISNHQSWADILILQKLFVKKIPFPRFFMKQQLIWLPLIGGVCWALDFPFMKRHSFKTLRKHPQLIEQDRITTKNSCKKYKSIPVSIISFLEGTRFTKVKHDKQQSKYQYLLRPKYSGLANTICAMDTLIKKVINVTIIYPQGSRSFWDYMCGKIPEVIIHLDVISIPDNLLTGQYDTDPKYKNQFKEWVNQIWQEKDEQIHKVVTNS